MGRGAWWAAVHGVAKSCTRLSNFTFTFSLSCIGEGNGNPLQCSCLENPRGRRAWWVDVYGVTQSRTRLKWLSSSSSSSLVLRDLAASTLLSRNAKLSSSCEETGQTYRGWAVLWKYRHPSRWLKLQTYECILHFPANGIPWVFDTPSRFFQHLPLFHDKIIFNNNNDNFLA